MFLVSVVCRVLVLESAKSNPTAQCAVPQIGHLLVQGADDMNKKRAKNARRRANAKQRETKPKKRLTQTEAAEKASRVATEITDIYNKIQKVVTDHADKSELKQRGTVMQKAYKMFQANPRKWEEVLLNDNDFFFRRPDIDSIVGEQVKIGPSGSGFEINDVCVIKRSDGTFRYAQVVTRDYNKNVFYQYLVAVRDTDRVNVSLHHMLTKNGTVKLEEGNRGNNFLYKVKTTRKRFKISFYDVVYAKLLIDEYKQRDARVSESSWAFMCNELRSVKDNLGELVAASKRRVRSLLYSYNNAIIPAKLRE